MIPSILTESEREKDNFNTEDIVVSMEDVVVNDPRARSKIGQFGSIRVVSVDSEHVITINGLDAGQAYTFNIVLQSPLNKWSELLRYDIPSF